MPARTWEPALVLTLDRSCRAGEPIQGNPARRLQFNSPDLNGDMSVDVAGSVVVAAGRFMVSFADSDRSPIGTCG